MSYIKVAIQDFHFELEISESRFEDLSGNGEQSECCIRCSIDQIKNTWGGVSLESMVSTRTWHSMIRGWGRRYPAYLTLGSRSICMRRRLPMVWSSFFMTKVPAFGFLLSGLYTSLSASASSSQRHARNLSGALDMIQDNTCQQTRKIWQYFWLHAKLLCNT